MLGNNAGPVERGESLSHNTSELLYFSGHGEVEIKHAGFVMYRGD
jgi:hypothetical protein